MRPMSRGERALVQWLKERCQAARLRVPIGLGDDMAAVRLAGQQVLVSADMLMEGVDYVTAEHSPIQIGRKALACGLSDCAAMAVRPMAALVSLALPSDWTMEQAQGLYEGMRPLEEAFDCPVVGGDTNSWSHPLAVDVIVVAQPWPGVRPVRRDGARPADGLYVSGPLGGSRLGRHLDFEPRVQMARRLAEALGDDLRAMLDISDGLALDLSRLCEASGTGAEIEVERVRNGALHADAQQAASNDGRSALEHGLHDGEDFELLAACGRSDDEIETPAGRWVRIGRIVESGLALIDGGERTPLEPRGWEHWK